MHVNSFSHAVGLESVWMAGWVGLRVGFININDMCNNAVGKGGV